MHFLWNPERSWLSWLYSYPCEHYLASFVSGLRGHSCFAFWNGQWPQTRAGFLSSRLSVWCTAIRHQNASQCLVIHWRPPVSSSVDLLKKQSLTRAFQARQRFHGGWRIIIELWHNRLPSSFAATRILHPNYQALDSCTKKCCTKTIMHEHTNFVVVIHHATQLVRFIAGRLSLAQVGHWCLFGTSEDALDINPTFVFSSSVSQCLQGDVQAGCFFPLSCFFFMDASLSNHQCQVPFQVLASIS